jgi:Sap, sulfolipid-1-addressing protein
VGDVGSIIGLALFAAVNPTLLAMTTIMMLLPNTKKLMFGYLLGAYITSISLGMAVVFSLHDSSSVSTAKRTLSPIEDLVIGAILLLVGYVLRSGRGDRLRERRKQHKEAKAQGKEPKQSWPERMLGRDSARITFVVGLLLSFPGVSYLAALTRIAKLDWAPVPTGAFVIVVALIQQSLLELPLLGYAFAPDWTEGAVARFRDWISRSGLRAASYVALVLGGLLILRGVVTLL